MIPLEKARGRTRDPSGGAGNRIKKKSKARHCSIQCKLVALARARHEETRSWERDETIERPELKLTALFVCLIITRITENPPSETYY